MGKYKIVEVCVWSGNFAFWKRISSILYTEGCVSCVKMEKLMPGIKPQPPILYPYHNSDQSDLALLAYHCHNSMGDIKNNQPYQKMSDYEYKITHKNMNRYIKCKT
jgi:hypothetical protein